LHLSSDAELSRCNAASGSSLALFDNPRHAGSLATLRTRPDCDHRESGLDVRAATSFLPIDCLGENKQNIPRMHLLLQSGPASTRGLRALFLDGSSSHASKGSNCKIQKGTYDETSVVIFYYMSV